jgi:site-specific DNA-methyltransferase (adenine-specific)
MKYPEDFINKIICGDHLEVMQYIPDDIIDLTVTSPPYDDLRDYEGYVFDYKKLIPELYRVTVPGGVVVWVVGDMVKKGSETGTSFRQALYFMECGFKLHDTMIYKKIGISYPETKRYYQIFEYMFIFSKGIPKTYNLLQDRINKTAGEKISKYAREKDGTFRIKSGNKKGRKTQQYGVRFNIWKYKTGGIYTTKDEIAYEQPAIFPDLLAYDHIRSWSNEGDIILDPMCGSGTTCKVAKNNNRRYIGIDCSEKYCNISRERCDNNGLFDT